MNAYNTNEIISGNEKWMIFDLDGTLADITERRKLADLGDGKIDWNKFFEPENIKLDKPNKGVIVIAQYLYRAGIKILILSGRSEKTHLATIEWLQKYEVPYDLIKMRPTTQDWNFMPDEHLKQYWLNKLFSGSVRRKNLIAVFDDRQKVVDMWRKNNVTCLQVAEGNF